MSLRRLVATEMPESVPRDLRLCARCVESFERWYWKRAKSSTSSAANAQPENAMASGIASVSKQSRRPKRKKKGNPLIRILTITTLTILLFLVVFYSTWTILKTATRPEE